MSDPIYKVGLEKVVDEDIAKLLSYFGKNTGFPKCKQPEYNQAMAKSTALMTLDYKIFLIANAAGELSDYYPPKLIIIENELRIDLATLSSKEKSPIKVKSPAKSKSPAKLKTPTKSPGKSRSPGKPKSPYGMTSPRPCNPRMSLTPIFSQQLKSSPKADLSSEEPPYQILHVNEDLNIPYPSASKCSVIIEDTSCVATTSQPEISQSLDAPTPSIREDPPAWVKNILPDECQNAVLLRELYLKARYARCRARFPVPVILYNNKFICRSATLSTAKEIYGRHSYEYLFGSTERKEEEEKKKEPDNVEPAKNEWFLVDQFRNRDIKLLKVLNVNTIIDLMVEQEKVKFFMYVSSSEKIDNSNRYYEFNVVSLPYPGCEFFKEFRRNNYEGDNLVFDWGQDFVNAELFIPTTNILRDLGIEWSGYKTWDIIKMTQNYIRLQLKYLQGNCSGLLIHCISGWDRTPLYISLLRMSLWADGVIHQNLNAHQLLYLTIAYDWMLFGHQLKDRIVKGEDIFVFCFYILKYLVDDEFSVIKTDTSPVASFMSDIDVDMNGKTHPIVPEKMEDVKSLTSVEELTFTLEPEEVTKHCSDPVEVMFNPEMLRVALNSDSSSSSPEIPPTMSVSYEGDYNDTLAPVQATTSMAISPRRRGTSPIQVPMSGKRRVRPRTESTSSITSVDSWQMVSKTGSIGSESNIKTSSENTTSSESQESSSTIRDTDSSYIKSRQNRLLELRKLFYTHYSANVGFKPIAGEKGYEGSN